MHDDFMEKPRPLREKVCDIDREILNLVMKRHNLVARIMRGKDRLDPHEERSIRESWESAASKVSTDPKLSSLFFILLQEIDFLPPPSEETPGRQPFFGLAPAQKQVSIDMVAPGDGFEARIWAALAATTGSPVRMEQVLMNDAVVDCLRMYTQLGSSLHREDMDTLCADKCQPAANPDKVLHVGDSPLNFYLSLVHYLSRPGHTKFTGGPTLKLSDFSPLRRFLPEIGTRVIPLVPRSNGLPVRIECSGDLPDTIVLPADLPMDFVCCLVTAAPFYGQNIRIDCAALPAEERERKLDLLIPLLEQAGVGITREDDLLSIQPYAAALPAAPSIHMDLTVAGVLLGLGAVLGGDVRLKGQWPESEEAHILMQFLQQLDNVDLQQDENGVVLHTASDYKITAEALEIPPRFPESLAFLPCALACVQALVHGKAKLPDFEGAGIALSDSATGLVRACGLELVDDEICTVPDREGRTPVWTAPTASWACALALAACARPAGTGFALNNPGLMTELYPGFWNLYNSLPKPELRPSAAAAAAAPVKERRRIRTKSEAQLTPRPEDDE